MGRVWDALAERNLQLGPAGDGAGDWRHWRLSNDANGVAWLVLDRADAGANTLSEEVLRELDDALGRVEDERPRGLVLRSAKPSGFMFGADIGEFGDLTASGAVEKRISDANMVFDRLERLDVPTVAVVHGNCLGGGLELVLCCDHRIAVEGARLGFPEVMLGLHPGLGGTVRATRLVDPVEAMTMMLTGRNLHARRARSIGLVDAVTEERHVEAAVAAAVRGELKSRGRSLKARLLDTGPGRRLAARRMRAETAKRAPKAHYPAPHALIDLWERHGDDSETMKRRETESFARLLVGDTSRNLVRVFFLREGLKKQAPKGHAFGHVHVVGAGAMGGDIAAWCAWHGLRVTLADMEARPLGAAIGRAAKLYGKIGRKRTDIRDALDRLAPDLHGDGVRHADVVIEAVPERLDLKRKVYADLEARMKDDAILATNTSSLPLEDLREGLARPERLVGLHFFNPVSRMQLVEVVSHDGADAAVLERARAFVGAIDRLPAPVKSAPGFLVNRALMPYLVEALAMMDEGTPPERIDAAAEDFGMPMGPIELADRVGLDICVHVADVLRESLDRPMPPTPDWLREKVDKGDLGSKTGRGLYDWKDGKPNKTEVSERPDAAMADRLVLPMLDVCVACLREGVVADEATLDGAMIFATGFAPFRGGPLNYARGRGVGEVRDALRRLAERHGERFRPDPGWDDLA